MHNQGSRKTKKGSKRDPWNGGSRFQKTQQMYNHYNTLLNAKSTIQMPQEEAYAYEQEILEQKRRARSGRLNPGQGSRQRGFRTTSNYNFPLSVPLYNLERDTPFDLGFMYGQYRGKNNYKKADHIELEHRLNLRSLSRKLDNIKNSRQDVIKRLTNPYNREPLFFRSSQTGYQGINVAHAPRIVLAKKKRRKSKAPRRTRQQQLERELYEQEILRQLEQEEIERAARRKRKKKRSRRPKSAYQPEQIAQEYDLTQEEYEQLLEAQRLEEEAAALGKRKKRKRTRKKKKKNSSPKNIDLMRLKHPRSGSKTKKKSRKSRGQTQGYEQADQYNNYMQQVPDAPIPEHAEDQEGDEMGMDIRAEEAGVHEDEYQQQMQGHHLGEEVGNHYENLNQEQDNDLIEKIAMGEAQEMYDQEGQELGGDQDSEERLMNYAKDLNIPIENADFDDQDGDELQDEDQEFGYMDYDDYNQEDIENQLELERAAAAAQQQDLTQGLPDDKDILQGNIMEDGKIDFDKIRQQKLANKDPEDQEEEVYQQDQEMMDRAALEMEQQKQLQEQQFEEERYRQEVEAAMAVQQEQDQLELLQQQQLQEQLLQQQQQQEEEEDQLAENERNIELEEAAALEFDDQDLDFEDQALEAEIGEDGDFQPDQVANIMQQERQLIEIDDGDSDGLIVKQQVVENLDIEVPGEEEINFEGLDAQAILEMQEEAREALEAGDEEKYNAIMKIVEETVAAQQMQDGEGEEEYIDLDNLPENFLKCLEELPVLEEMTEEGVEEFEQKLYQIIVSNMVFESSHLELLFQALCDQNDQVEPNLLQTIFQEVYEIIQEQINQEQGEWEGEGAEDEDGDGAAPLRRSFDV